MSGIKDQKNIDDLRKRLYERGNEAGATERHSLTPRPVEVSRGWDMVEKKTPLSTPNLASVSLETPADRATEAIFSEHEVSSLTLPKPKKRRYRTVIIVLSLLFFIITVGVSSVYLFFGANQISAKNISITLSAPFSVAGGEELPLQISIANQNDVAIESATLIINYPPGARSTEEGNKELYEERVTVEAIKAGQAVNIPIRVILYGEENESKEIKAAVEYRMEGSNGNFFKKATPVLVQISSSPLVLRVTGVEKISSGQEMELRLKLQSNASAVQKNILVAVDYPDTFSFTKSTPETVYGENTWLIPELKPEETYEILVQGLVTGLSSQVSEMQFRAGTPETGNQFIMGSVLYQTKFSYTIEQPFTAVVVEVNGDRDGEVVLPAGERAAVKVKVTNTLEESIYDMRVELSPRGNLIRDDQLDIFQGFYDTNTKSIRYDVSGDSTLAEIKPGETREFSFQVDPDKKQATASFNVSAGIYARRLNEDNAAEALIGTALTEVKYSSVVTVGSQAGYNEGAFTDVGPIPPVVNTATTYTATLVVEAGVNTMTGAVVTTSLPQYVSWLDQKSGDGMVEFNPVSKQLKWNLGDVEAGGRKTLQFQVSLLPSVTQVGDSPILLGRQELKATDGFTGVALRAQNSELSNELSTEFGFVAGNGIIQAKP